MIVDIFKIALWDSALVIRKGSHRGAAVQTKWLKICAVSYDMVGVDHEKSSFEIPQLGHLAFCKNEIIENGFDLNCAKILRRTRELSVEEVANSFDEEDEEWSLVKSRIWSKQKFEFRKKKPFSDEKY